MHLAARAAGPEMLAALLDSQAAAHGDVAALVNAPDRLGLTPVFLAHQRGEEGQAAFECLLARGARFNQAEMDAQAAAAGGFGGSLSGGGGAFGGGSFSGGSGGGALGRRLAAASGAGGS